MHVLSHLACPVCRGPLAEGEAHLRCASCGARFPAALGAYDLRPGAGDSNKAAQAHIYDERLGELSNFHHPHNLTLFTERRWLQSIPLHPGDRVLELGGHRSGALPFLEKERGIRGSGVDISPHWVAEQNRLARARGADTWWVRGDAEHLPFADSQFPAMVSFDVFEHVSDLGAAMSEASRVLQPGGHLLAHMPVNDVGLSFDGLQKLFVEEAWRERQRQVGHDRDRMATWSQVRTLIETAGLELTWHMRFNVWVQPLHDHRFMAWLGNVRRLASVPGSDPPAPTIPTGPPSHQRASKFQRLYSRYALPLARVLAAPDWIGGSLGVGGSVAFRAVKPPQASS
jgi:SAM-dependent methyltransferase